MKLTLDEFLAEVDRWKNAVKSELDSLSVEEQRIRLMDARRQIEKAIKHSLPELPAGQPTT